MTMQFWLSEQARLYALILLCALLWTLESVVPLVVAGLAVPPRPSLGGGRRRDHGLPPAPGRDRVADTLAVGGRRRLRPAPLGRRHLPDPFRPERAARTCERQVE